MIDKIEINFVVHKGKLEDQALLLATSLRYFNGNNYHINACIPKDFGGVSSGISPKTKQRLIDLNVNLKEIENPISNEYLIGNKLLCLDNENDNYRVFLDTDIICCNKLIFPHLEKNTIAIKPADRKTYHWDRKTWEKAYKKYANYDLLEEDIVISTAFNETILPYFNAGVIMINGCKDFSKQWAGISKLLDEDDCFQGKRPWLDQLTLPLTIKKLSLTLQCLNETHNFPANIKPVDNHNIQLVHYHRPGLISRNKELIKCLKKIIIQYPWLQKSFENKDWNIVHETINSQNNSNPQNYLITGFSKYQLNNFANIVTQNQQNSVSIYPDKILTPLRKRNIPWGVNAFYSDTLRNLKISSDIRVNNLFTCHDIAYIINLPRLFRVLPNTIFIGLFEEPIQTITSWNKCDKNADFFPSTNTILNDNRKWLDPDDMKLINKIEKTQSKIIRQALFWNFYAIQLIKHRKDLLLIDSNDLFNKPSALFKIIKDQTFDSIEKTNNENNYQFKLSIHDRQIVKNLASQLYADLKQTRDTI